MQTLREQIETEVNAITSNSNGVDGLLSDCEGNSEGIADLVDEARNHADTIIDLATNNALDPDFETHANAVKEAADDVTDLMVDCETNNGAIKDKTSIWRAKALLLLALAQNL